MAPGAPSLRALVLELPPAHDGASILKLAWVRKFLAALLLQVRVLVPPGWAADAALRLALARKFLAVPLLPRAWVLALPDWAADAEWKPVLASLGSLGRYAALVWPPSPAFPPEPASRCAESQKEARRKTSFRAGSAEPAFLESLPLVKHPEVYLDLEIPLQILLNWVVFSARYPKLVARQPVPGCRSVASKKESASVDLAEVDFVRQRSF